MGKIITIAKTGEAPEEVTLDNNDTVAKALKYRKIKLKEGEVLERNGKVIGKGTKPKDGDIIFITEDDGNGKI